MRLLGVLVLCLTCLLGCSFTSHSIIDGDYRERSDSPDKVENIDQALFERIIDIGYELYNPIAEAKEESLLINKKWDDSTINASATRIWALAIVNMYGGLARHYTVTPGGFALVLCHELSHLYGGTPYVAEPQELSAEGQADYMGSKECLRKVFAKLELDSNFYYPTNYMTHMCELGDEDLGKEEDDKQECDRDESKEGIEACNRILLAGKSVGNMFSVLMKEDTPQYYTPDETVVEETTVQGYPPIQCRLDTYKHGALEMDRPACWFKDKAVE